MKRYLFYFALTGWTLGLIVHILSLTDIDITGRVPFVWLPVVLDLKNSKELKEYQQSGMLNRMNPIGFYKIIFKETPTWMAIIAGAGFIYAFINFMLSMFSQQGTPSIQDGQFILQNHGKLIKNLTEQEYHHYKANEIRGFSGHWVLFYGIATALLFKYSGLRKNMETN